MKKLLFTLLSALALCNAQAAVVLSGSGTMDDPYLIQSDDDLNRFSSLVDEGNCNICGKLTRNITMFANFTFTPIGTSKHRFKGHFDGCGYQIIKFKLEAQGESCGMFGEVENATIKNLNIYGTMESTANNGTAIGTVVGYACGNTVIENVRSGVDMTISHSGYSHIGGIVGTLDDGVQVKRCHYSGTLNVGGNRDCIGGIVGYAYPDCWGGYYRLPL